VIKDITYEPIKNEKEGSGDENTISYYEKQLIVLRDEKFPLAQQVAEINHKIEQIKSLIKIKTQEYWSSRE
jgi:hypothetical protein